MILSVEYEIVDRVNLLLPKSKNREYRLKDLTDDLLIRFKAVPYGIPVALYTEDFGEVEAWHFYRGVLELTCTLNQLNQIVQNKFTFKNEE